MKRLVILLCLVLVGCGTRALSADEAARLADVRVANHAAQTAIITFTPCAAPFETLPDLH